MPVETKEQYFYFSDQEIKMWVVKDIEALVTDPEDEDCIPYWADVWPAAGPMAQYIWEETDMKGSEVMELGAGLGLPGIVAGLRGAKVTFSDYQEEALGIILNNARANGVENAEIILGDWRAFTLTKKFDWILASEILYNPRLNPYAERILMENLKDDGQILVTHARRPATYEALERIKSKAPFWEKVKVVPVTIEDPYYPNYQVSLHHLGKIK